MRRGAATPIAVLVLLRACRDDATTASTSTTAAPATTSTTEPLAAGTLDQVTLEVEEVAELDEPIAMAVRPGGTDLYVAEKAGRVRLIKVTEDAVTEKVTWQLQTTPLLDLSDEVVNEGERGLLGMAFSSDGRKVYVNFTREPDGATVVLEYELGDRPTIDLTSRRELLVVDQPYPNHNGGHLVTGPDGFLYIGLGDGGSSGDPDGNGQDRGTLLGSILRIDPEAGDDDTPYGIPEGNPFVDDDGARPEIWLYGVRNPWRFSFDRLLGDLWVADVGQDDYEEINRLPSSNGFDAGRGDNLGWDEMEATHPFQGGENPDGAVLPVFEYGRDAGCSVTGGHVYRGEAIAGLAGVYLYADLCSGGIRGLQLDQGQVVDARTWDLPVQQLYSFGQDDAGELYLLSGTGQVLLLTAG